MLPGLTTPLDPLHNDGYQWWSGLGSGSAWLAAIGVWFHHQNCIVKGCWRKGHPDPEHGHPTCRHHQHKLNP